jgi:hypothetical protein
MTYTLPTQITLAQFEAVDAAWNGVLRAVAGEEARAESRLFTALIDTLGYAAASDIAVLEDYAAELVTACLLGRVETLDVEAA